MAPACDRRRYCGQPRQRSTGPANAAVAAAIVMLCLAGCAAGPVATPAFPEGTRVEAVRLPSRGVQIPATLVVPPTARDAALPFVLLVHGHGGTRDEAGGFTRVAAGLAQVGIASIRMDFPGCGDSDEPFTENNLTNMMADVRAAHRYAMQWSSVDPARVGVVGFSMGARVTAGLIGDGERFAAVALWAPSVTDGAGRMVDMLGGPGPYAEKRAAAQAAGFAPFTTFWGQEQQLGLRWFEDLEQSRPMAALARYAGALLLVHGTEDAVIPIEVSRQVERAAIGASMVDLVQIQGADHGFGLFSEPDRYSRELVERTVRFFAQNL